MRLPKKKNATTKVGQWEYIFSVTKCEAKHLDTRKSSFFIFVVSFQIEHDLYKLTDFDVIKQPLSLSMPYKMLNKALKTVSNTKFSMIGSNKGSNLLHI